MRLSELLIAIDKIAADKGLSKPYIVGGLTRDKLLERIEQINDVDITTGDRGIHFLASEIAERLKEHPTFSYEEMANGYSKITIDGFKLDLSSNFKVPGIDAILQEVGIDEPTEMQKELYSRDFTCNAALMTLDLSKIVDPTGLAVTDIKERVVRTLLPPKLTLGYDNNRIVRVIYLAAKLGFEVDPSIKEWIKEHPELIANSRPDYISKKLKKAAEYSPEIAGNLLTELGLWKYVPLIPELIEYQKADLVRGASKKKKTKKRKTKKTKTKDKKRVDMDVRPYPSLLFKNFDYGGPEGGSDVSPGTGLYQGWMGKYKSTKDFIEKSRKRRHRRAALLQLFVDLKKKASYETGYDIEERIQELGRRNPRPFNDWFGGKDRVYIPFDMSDDPEANEEIDSYRDDVISALKETYPDKCDEIDFVEGYCSKGNNRFRIGKLLNSARNRSVKEVESKIKEFKKSETFSEYDAEYISLQNEHQKVSSYWLDIINAFVNSPIRARKNTKDVGHYVVMSQNPIDIAYMSTYRNWESCMTLPVGEHSAGQHHEDVFCEVEQGGLIAYLIKANDKDIQDPIARIRIRRFENQEGDSHAIPEKAIYGDEVAGFADVVKSWIVEHQNKQSPGIYKLKGGEWSDTFSSSLVIAPDDEKSLTAWISAPEEEEGAIITYWVVIDHLKVDERDLFDEDVLGDFAGDTPVEKIFYNESEARQYSETVENLEINDYIYEALDRECESEYIYHHQYGPHEDRLSPQEIEDGIANEDHIKDCRYKEYLGGYERFRVEEQQDDRTSIMRRAVADKILENPGVYTPSLVVLVKNYIFDSKHLADRTLKERFVKQYANEYPDIANILSEERSNSNLKMLASFYKTLRESGEKENVRSILKEEIEFAFDRGIEGMDGAERMWLMDRMGLLDAFNPIPADIAAKAVEFANNIDASGISQEDKLGLINHLMHQFAMTDTDVPVVQRFYESRLPMLNVIPTKDKWYRAEQGLEGHRLDDLGYAVARLGENGRRFIPFFKQKIEEVRDWQGSDIKSFEEYLADELKKPFGEKNPEKIRKTYKGSIAQTASHIKEYKKKTIERLLYIIDALETGAGYSSKFRFLP